MAVRELLCLRARARGSGRASVRLHDGRRLSVAIADLRLLGLLLGHNSDKNTSQISYGGKDIMMNMFRSDVEQHMCELGDIGEQIST